MSAALAYRSIPRQAAYRGARHAIRGYVDSVRCELRNERRAVHIGCVRLAAFNVPQFLWGRAQAAAAPPVLEPQVAARAIVWMVRRRP